MAKKIFRQGDIMLLEADLPAYGRTKEVLPNMTNYILAKGEATGHKHVLPVVGVTELIYRTGSEAIRYFKVEKEVSLTHEEHDPIKIPPGVYRFIQQREYDPKKEMLYVAD